MSCAVDVLFWAHTAMSAVLPISGSPKKETETKRIYNSATPSNKDRTVIKSNRLNFRSFHISCHPSVKAFYVIYATRSIITNPPLLELGLLIFHF